jgi:hypothetical protein
MEMMTTRGGTAGSIRRRVASSIDKGRNVQHDGGTEGHTRRRVASTKVGRMTTLGNTARGGMAGQRWQGAARRWAAQRGQRQQGVAWRDNKGKGRHGSEGQDGCHQGGTESSMRRMAAALLMVDFVGGASGERGD